MSERVSKEKEELANLKKEWEICQKEMEKLKVQIHNS